MQDGTVYFVPYSIHKDPRNVLVRMRAACEEVGIATFIRPDDFCAIKMHFGEFGITSYLRPAYPRTLVAMLKDLGARPFLTDTNTLYRVARHNAVDHLTTAHQNGFSYGSVGAPLIIADGLHGHAHQEVDYDGKHLTKISIPDAIHDADSMLVLSHFTAHLAAGFGAAVKNLSMGCSNPQGKRRMHCHSKPTVDTDTCTACGMCARWCPTGAITVDDYASVNEDLCMACGECTVVCPVQAVKIPWDENSSILQEKMAEHAHAVVQQKKDRIFFVNCLVDITPHCDCMEQSEPVFKPDVGILLGSDPVAVDQACIDFVSGKLNWDGRRLTEGEPGDPLRAIYKHIDWQVQLAYAETIGLGSRSYELKLMR